jgi:hypothetical protein
MFICGKEVSYVGLECDVVGCAGYVSDIGDACHVVGVVGIGGIGVVGVIRRTNCYNTHGHIDHHHHRAKVHQGNDTMYQGHPLHGTNSKPSLFFRLLQT